MAFLDNDVRDNGLQRLSDRVNAIHVCSQEPTTFAEATSTYSLGLKATPTVSAPAAGSSGGRRVTAAAFSDGAASADGMATHFAWVDTVNNILYAAKALSNSQEVTDGNAFSLSAHDITIPAAV